MLNIFNNFLVVMIKYINNWLYFFYSLIILIVYNMFNIINCDVPIVYQYDFQDPASSFQEGITYLHDDLMFLLSFIFGFVFCMLFLIVKYYGDSRVTTITLNTGLVQSTLFYQAPSFHTFLEFVWTIIPSFILLVLVLPTFSLIYSLDDLFDIQLTLKIIGHQWYWSYEYSDLVYSNNNAEEFNTLPATYGFDSYLLPETDLVSGSLRLLEVDNRLILPAHVHIRLLVTSADVLHSWAVPSLGVKMDACPGRLNQVALFITRVGVFYGQCSEICGINHAFMPICVESVL